MASALSGGKTPPRLLEDARLYNPHRLPLSRFNVLTSLPVLPAKGSLPRKTGRGACTHDWKLKENQCSVPENSVASKPTDGQVSAYCALCRCHLKLQLCYPESRDDLRPCPQRDAPLHHFLHRPAESAGFQRLAEGGGERWEDQERFRCSQQQCQAELTVKMISPRLNLESLDLLTNKELIKKRAQAAIDTYPARYEGIALPTPVEVIMHLGAYLNNAIANPEVPREIKSTNKRWMLYFGDSCNTLLEFLGFHRSEEGFWKPPQPSTAPTLPLNEDIDILLDDVLKELTVLLSFQDEDDRRAVRFDPHMIAASTAFRRLLSCLEYDMNPGAQNTDRGVEDEHPFYAGLGAVISFHDALIIFGYEQQQLTDPENSPYYLQCLQGIAKGRRSESLHTKAAIEESSGKVSLDDISSAYVALGLDASLPVDEETVIGTFQSRIADAPRQEPELRRCLRIIGQHINSQRIEDYASDTINTYEQALAWLGATSEMGDDFVTSMYSLKVNENPANIEMARNCMRIIATTRKSDGLLVFLDTGELGQTEMDPSSAYEYLVPGNRDAEDDLILSHYTAALADTPSQKPELDRALRAIAKARNSNLLLSMSGGPDPALNTHDLSEWPIGLENIGNTCYLNSLLQFLFTIKPLRSLVLQNGDYLMEIDSSSVNKKKVGSRQVTRREIERAQQFIKELATLFQEMISTPKAQITPKLELARLTMLSTFAEEGLRRQSVLGDSRPILTNIDADALGDADAIGDPEFPADDVVLVDSPLAEVKPNEQQLGAQTSVEADGSSEGTLVDAPAEEPMLLDIKDTPVPVVDNKENLSPTKENLEHHRAPEQDLKPLAATSPSRVNQESQNASQPAAAYDGDFMDISSASTASGPPSRPPPPVPARGKPERRTTINEEELYRQQDVTEVIGNVLFQLQCAIKPDKIDASGEQIDLIKRLFYGKMKTTTTDAAGKPRTMEEFFSDLKINVSSEPPDLYSGLDSLFDRRMVELGSSEQAREEAQFSTITELPSVLQIHPIRTAFDRQRGAYKVNHQFAFDEVIYVDRYMDGGDAITQKKRAQCWEMKDQLKRIEERHVELGRNELGLDARETLLLTAEYLQQLEAAAGPEVLPEADPPLLAKVQQAAADVRAELTTLAAEEEQLRADLRAAWADATFQTRPYRLHAVFLHRGMVSSGHYWVYIYDQPRGIWRKYNDGYVTAVDDPATEIFGQQPGDRPPTPMFLVYVAQALAADLVEVVHRELPATPPAEDEAPPQLPPSSSAAAGLPPPSRAATTTALNLDADMPPPGVAAPQTRGGTW